MFLETNNSIKFARQFYYLLRYFSEYVDGQNNYDVNTIYYQVVKPSRGVAGIIFETACRNQYGSIWCNNDEQFIAAPFIPNYLWNHLNHDGERHGVTWD